MSTLDDKELRTTTHEYAKEAAVDETVKGRDFTVQEHEVPAGYFYSLNFIGSMFAIGLSLGSGVAGFAIVAPVLGAINDDLGPSPIITWVSLAYLLTTAIFQVIVGRLTDIFGRRWFMISGNATATVGSIVCATTPGLGGLIAGEVLLGLGASFQLCYAFAIAELVPIRWRFLAVGFACTWLIPGSGLAPAIAYYFTYISPVGWRGVFYYLTGLNAFCTTLWFLFYRPPNFRMKHGNARKWQFIKDFDYFGTLLFIIGMLLFLLGISWGGTLHPWKSAHVISTIIIGVFVLVAFVCYETFVKLKEPVMPVHFYKRRDWNCTIVLWALGAALYYANAILWPSMVAVLYGEGHSIMYSGWASCIANSGIIFGEWLVPVGGLFPKRSRQISAAFALGAVFIACMSTCDANTPVRAMVFMFIGSALIGFCEIGCSVTSTFTIDDQREIGTATGLASSIRSAVSSVASAIFSATLSNRLAKTIPAYVPPAVLNAGLPESSLVDFITALTGDRAALDKINGVTPSIIAAGTRAYQTASYEAYKTVYIVTLAFTGIGIIVSFFFPNVDHLVTKDLSVQLHKRSEEGETA